MKRIIIICEGPTEIEFCKDVLYPHFLSREILIQTPLIKKSSGGIVPWQILRKQVETHLLQDVTSIVTTLIDYYGIKDKFLFPGWQHSKDFVDKSERMTFLEKSMREALPQSLNHRFFPYIQLHEFEGLLFNEISVFENLFSSNDLVNKAELLQVLNQYDNPELINDSQNNAPSYRLKRIIKGYNKIVYGSVLAQEIGLDRIRNKSPRFNEWIGLLEI